MATFTVTLLLEETAKYRDCLKLMLMHNIITKYLRNFKCMYALLTVKQHMLNRRPGMNIVCRKKSRTYFWDIV